MPEVLFFTSYARLDNNEYTKLGEAVDELRERVRGIVGAARLDEIGFFDLEDIKTGANWVERLGEAVATCRMFVCFCSNTYFNREVCGKEFEVFRQRLGETPPRGRYVFPIIWDKCQLPQSMQRFQANARTLPREYFEDGLLALRRVQRDAEYKTTIERLAQLIADAVNDDELPHGAHPIDDFDALPSAFDNPGENAVRICVLTDESLRWAPIPGRTARLAVEEATSSSQVRWRQLENGAGLAPKLAASSPKDQPIVLIVPPPDAVWAQRIAGIDRALATEGRAPCAVLIGRKKAASGAPAEPDDDAVRRLFPNSFGFLASRAVFDQNIRASLPEKLRLAIGALHARALAAGDVAVVRDATLETNARDAGVPVTRAVLSGPVEQP